MNFKLVGVPTNQGCLEKNVGTINAPIQLLKKKSNFKNLNIPKNNFEESIELIYKNALKKKNILYVGGDHSITFPLAKAFKKNFPKKSCLVIFDAHVDCMQNFFPPSHEDFVNYLVSKKILKASEIIIIGVRKIYKLEKEFLSKNKIKIIKASEIKKDFKKSLNDIKLFTSKFDNIYLSIDIDAIDPEFAPGTGYLVKNGLDFKELKKIFELIKDKIKLADLVEINLEKEKTKTKKIALKIIKLFSK